MRIAVIDGQGGAIGAQLIRQLIAKVPEAKIVAIGTNSIATSNMLKSGARTAATGENAVKVAARRADVIVGPVGIVIADALWGEVTADMAAAIGASPAIRVLIPMSRCDTLIAGVAEASTSVLIDDAIKKIQTLEASNN
ncbi:MAG: DUF3842 family protein [Firmicutes bacterium]|nr:DUF3842 family protein [Bacillota bacterium]